MGKMDTNVLGTAQFVLVNQRQATLGILDVEEDLKAKAYSEDVKSEVGNKHPFGMINGLL